MHFSGGLEPPKPPSKPGGPPKKWVDQQWLDKEVVQLHSSARVTRNVGSTSDRSGAQNSQQGGSSQGGSQQGGSQQSANTVVIKRVKECRHCGKSLPGINPTDCKNHLLNIRKLQLAV